MAANPFLFTEDDITSPQQYSTSTVSNPFLLEEDNSLHDGQITTDNPFFTPLGATATAPTTTMTNPFAFDPEEFESAEPEVSQNLVTNAFVNFEDEESLFTNSTQEIIPNSYNKVEEPPAREVVNTTIPVQLVRKPTDLDLKYGHQSSDSGPARPPPPLYPAPSKETQDLFTSVMGAMDATSSSLLDKIPPTRTPSPVSMRDLHSPSPTPETNFGDLLDVSDTKTEKVPDHVNETTDLLELGESTCDINQNPSQISEPLFLQKEPVIAQPPVVERPPPPGKPPRPAPPQKPPPPVIRNPPPTKPPPPVIRNTQQNIAQNEMMDMFDVEVQHKKPATKDDILNLYNAPIVQTPQTDLLCDSIEPEVINTSSTDETLTSKKPIREAIETETASPLSAEMPKETLLSPETNNDLQMDTSDSQSKGSVSSVTFNPFAGNDDLNQISPIKQEDFQHDNNINDVFQGNPANHKNQMEIFSTPAPAPTPVPAAIQDSFEFGMVENKSGTKDDFDAFAEKFDSFKSDENKNGIFDAFSGTNNAWGNEGEVASDSTSGFGTEETFDSFLALQEPPIVPQSTPNRISKAGSQESEEEKDFSVVIRPRAQDDFSNAAMPIIAPPPVTTHTADTSPRFNPFDQQQDFSTPNESIVDHLPTIGAEIKRTDSQETPPTPLFDDDVSQPLQPFPRIELTGEEGWEMQLRQPNKKKITGQRFWKKIFVKLVHQPDCVLLQLYNQQSDKDPFQELPLQPCYSVSDIGAQQYDQFGKIFTVKLQYIFYKERPGVRPGQVKKAERITNKLSQFAAYAIQGDYQGVKEFGSDLKKLGLPVEHAPQVSQLMKLGSLSFEDLKQFSFCIEEALFKLSAHRDRALHYKMEEVQITAVDELYVEQNAEGSIEKQIARVRLFFLGFLTGMPDVELGINDMRRQGKEVVGRHDIIPVVTEEWIRLEEVEFHSCIQQDEYNDTHIIKFKPPDACYIELLRFRVRPPKNRELPLQLKAQICITGTRVELRADVLVPGFASRKLGQIPCEDVMIRFPIPECWIYMFRVEKHFRYGSVKSAHRRTGKIKGIERILGTVETLQENLIEVTSGQAKYEHQHRAIVWRCPRLPKEGQGAYTTHNMVCRIALTSYDQMPDKLAEYCYVEFTMPATQVSHTTVRSVSLQNSDSDEPPEKYVRYLARHEYRVGIEHTEGENPNPYAAATYTAKPAPVPEEKPAPVVEESSSDSD